MKFYHTQHCRVCQDAVKNINRFTVLSYIGAIACLFLALFLDERHIATEGVKDLTLPSLEFWIAIAGAIILAIAGYLLKKLSRLFYVYKFSHVDND